MRLQSVLECKLQYTRFDPIEHISSHSILDYSRGFQKESCDCLWGFKGADCGIPCISVFRTDVCSLNPTKIGCTTSMNVPCNGKGTFDSQDFRYLPLRDDAYDCEPDGNCICRRGYQGQACEIGEMLFSV
jgi:hypothetical protein